MKSGSHAAISLAVAGGALALTDPPVSPPVVVAVVLVAGVGIDVDHFLLAWRRTGSFDAVRRCLGDPAIVFVRQDEIFREGDVGAIERLLSHVVIGGVAVPLCWIVSPYVAGLTAVAVYCHVLADLYATNRSCVAVETDDPRLDR